MANWNLGNYSFALGKKTYIMGILNVTPDSFSDGGKYLEPANAAARALEMQEQGADIIDIGAQSTRPGHTRISPGEEGGRLIPVLDALRGKLFVPVSVDTFYPQVAALALEHGASAINDVAGFSDPGMFRLAAQSGCGCIIMHNGELHDGGCGGDEVLKRVKSFFELRLRQAEEYGISRERICFDPGVGFGKTQEENLKLLANVAEMKLAGCAFLMAASRKRVIGAPCGDPPFQKRLAGTIAAHTIAQAGGADILRVHDVGEAVQAALVADAVLGQRTRG